MLDSPLFKIATGAEDFSEMEDYLLASGFESKPTSRSMAQYQQFQNTEQPEIKDKWRQIPFVIAVHPETAKWYIPGTARSGQGLASLQRCVKRFTQENAPVESVAPADNSTATDEMNRLVEMSQIQNSALEPRGVNSRRETYRDINNTHNRSLRFLNKTLKDFGFGDYEVWKGEKHMGSSKETYVRFNPLRSSFGQTSKGYERTPKYHSYTRYAGDYGMVEPADLAAMIASHRGYDIKFPDEWQLIMSKTRMTSDPSWYKWSVNHAPKIGSLVSIVAADKRVLDVSQISPESTFWTVTGPDGRMVKNEITGLNIAFLDYGAARAYAKTLGPEYMWTRTRKYGSKIAGDIVPDGQDDALDKKTEPVEAEEHQETELGGNTVPTEPPNQNAVREAVETAHDYEVGKTIEEKEAEVEGGATEQVDNDGKVKITKTPTQITINIGV